MNEIRNLIEKLNFYTKLYDIGSPIIPDEEWDNLYFQLATLEQETGLIYPDSPTQKISYQVVSELPKVIHDHPMLSLAKTKSIDEVVDFLEVVDGTEFISMCKMDGLTCSLRYENGELVRAETRGDGRVGEDITSNARVVKTIPQKISYTGKLTVDGEIICKIDDFMNYSETYKNSRNFASGSIRLLDSRECAKRSLTFVAWDAIGLECKKLSENLVKLNDLGFTVVPFRENSTDVEAIKLMAKNNFYPIDGVVFKFDDIEKYQSLGITSHHPKGGIAFKFYDEVVETKLLDIEWGLSRTSVLTPVAIFEPVEIDGTTVERASLHNLAILKDLLGTPYVGQPVEVVKANQIIPQIVAAEKRDNEIPILRPVICPSCGFTLKVKGDNLVCDNDECQGSLLHRLDHFCSKKGLDIKGLSEATLEKLINLGWIENFEDIYYLKKYKDKWIQQPGFGKASVNNILEAIETSKNTDLISFLTAIGIPMIGRRMSIILANNITSYEEFRNKVKEKFDFSQYAGFAGSKKQAILDFDYTEADKVYEFLNIQQPEEEKEMAAATLADQVICITGRLTAYPNRAALVKEITSHGGKVVDKISSRTTMLINNDIKSTSAKNIAAKEMNIPIITEDDFKRQYVDF